MSPLRRTLDIAGSVLVGAGIVLLLFTVYQIWGTSIQEAHTQAGLRTTLARRRTTRSCVPSSTRRQRTRPVADGPSRDGAAHQDPPEGDPVGDIRIP